MIRVLVADDHAVVRRGVMQILNEEADVNVVAEAGSGVEALERALNVACDVVVLDMNLPDISGLEVLGRLQQRRPGLPVLFLSMFPEQQFAVQALRAGAAGYLTKESAPEELVTAVRHAARGGRYVSASLGQLLVDYLIGEAPELPHHQLSEREFQVLRALGGGKSASEIAEELALSVKTISTYRSRILAKLDLSTTADIVRYAIRHELIE